jgi:hypothetical protein
MRTVHWLFIVGALLFVSGIGLVIAAARAVREVPPAAAPSVAAEPVATVRQIMKGIVDPAAKKVYDAVSTTVGPEGVVERVPKTDEDWEEVATGAAALIESGNLMLMGNRAVDQDEWVKMSRAMIDAGKQVLRATQEKNSDKVFELGEPLNESCDSCHAKYRRGL